MTLATSLAACLVLSLAQHAVSVSSAYPAANRGTSSRAGRDADPSHLSDSMVTSQDLNSEIDRVRTQVRDVYKTLHTNPERGHDQPHAHDLIRAALQQIGFTEFVESRLATTAVIAVLDTKRPGPIIALRAEMDALGGVTEPLTHDPRSSVAKVMHACGHDAHAAMLLGAANILWHNQDAVSGKIIFLFQPAEEVKGGADEIVAESLLVHLGVQAIFAQHAAPGTPVGTVSIAPGPTLAGSNSFTIGLKGVSSHAAEPFRGSDVPQALVAILNGLPDVASRRIDVLANPAVISVTFISAGDSTAINRIADSATARGTIRTFGVVDPPSPDTNSLGSLLRNYVARAGAAYGTRAAITINEGSPPTINDAALFERTIPNLTAVWPGRVDTSPYRGMFSEDFAFYTRQIPSLYFGWGIARDGLGMVSVHNEDFTIHPSAFDQGVRFLVLLAQVATARAVLLR